MTSEPNIGIWSVCEQEIDIHLDGFYLDTFDLVFFILIFLICIHLGTLILKLN